jgi:hypothetical protein
MQAHTVIAKIFADTALCAKGQGKNFRDNNIGGSKMPCY